ncbi:acetoin utilization AcuB family protein [Fervidibacillus halotolerans]|uniref:Acetoin utilization AcuB family protein n=1 Tax=Fervidibacillus halotolerans TaxID=2980027 RepID=A0A9E8RY11_9BACI|nr:acetoin utilization AcuB family protein [Fervidibacillus halotolerans]WAA11733.1 acetoin utilization AcuB family protein [Fervidibacillus halotolerans]
MLVEEMMVTDVITLKKEDSIKNAVDLMKEKKIRHLPIVDRTKTLIGIVTDRDIRSAVPSIFCIDKQKEFLNKPLETIMTTDVITAHPLDFVEEVAATFYKHRIGSLPVVKKEKLVGIITQTDVLKTFVELTGTNQPGTQIEIRVPNKPGTLADILQQIRHFHTNVLSVLIYPDKMKAQSKIIVLRLGTINPNPIINALKEHQYEILWPNLSGYHNG